MTLDELWTGSGAAAWGTCAYRDLLPAMDEAARAKAAGLCPDPAGVFVAAYPYFPGDTPGNLTLYARGQDYHVAIPRRMEQVCEGLRTLYPGRNFVRMVDDSPLPERMCAGLAGVGLRGRNGMTIVPPWGTYLFLGTVLTDLPLESAPEISSLCMDCGACLEACPSGALTLEGVDRGKCLSDLTQRKGELTDREREALSRHGLVWGCDLCQRVCPYNQDVPLSPLPEFREDQITDLEPEDVACLTNRQFREKYAGRAFTWRGPGVLRRNLELHRESSGGAEGKKEPSHT